jgi:hypothetical protein
MLSSNKYEMAKLGGKHPWAHLGEGGRIILKCIRYIGSDAVGSLQWA